jgi:FkbM family methyltransferase
LNLLERRVDAIDPRLSVKLRGLKLRMQRDPLSEIIRQFVKPFESVADIGANRGVYTWRMSLQVGPNGCVHSIEPYPGNIDRLTTLASSRRNITVHPVALSDNDGEATLRVPRHHDLNIDALASLRSNVAESAVPIQVKKRKLDSLLPPDECRLGFIKCDVEGHEDEVVAGAWNTITRHRPVMVIEIEQRHRATPVTDLIDRIVAVGYHCFFIDELGLHPIATFDIERDQLKFLTDEFVPHAMPHGYVNNFLFVPAKK